jgi:hypothetical protein
MACGAVYRAEDPLYANGIEPPLGVNKLGVKFTIEFFEFRFEMDTGIAPTEFLSRGTASKLPIPD